MIITVCTLFSGVHSKIGRWISTPYLVHFKTIQQNLPKLSPLLFKKVFFTFQFKRLLLRPLKQLLKCGFCNTANRSKSEEKSVQLAEVHLYRIYFLQNPYFRQTKECYLLSMKELFLSTIRKPPEVLLNKIFVSVSVSFFLFPCSKGQAVRAYLNTI